MLELTKLARWAAPGAGLVFTYFAFVALQRLIPLSSASFKPPIDTTAEVAIAAVSAIPLGLVVYQLYIFGFERPSRLRLWVHLDAGQAVVERLPRLQPIIDARRGAPATLPSFEVERIALATVVGWKQVLPQLTVLWLKDRTSGQIIPLRWRDRRQAFVEYYARREQHWTDVEWLLTTSETEDPKPSARSLAELDRLAEIYHTLGASRLALVIAWLASVVVGGLTSITGQNGWGYLLGVLASAVATALLFYVMHTNRRRTLLRRNEVLAAVLGVLHPATPSAQTGTISANPSP